MHAPVRRSGRAGCPARGRCRGAPRAAAARRRRRRAAQVSPRSRTGTPPRAQHGRDVGRQRLLVARLRRDVDQLERPRGEPLSEVRHGPHNSLRAGALLRRRHLRQARQPAARHAARAARARGRHRAGRDVLRAGHGGAGRAHDRGLRPRPGGRRRRRAVGPAARPARARRAAARRARLPDGRYERMRVCDALLFRRGLPLYPVPAAGQSPQRLGAVDRRRLRALRGARRARPLPAARRPAARSSPSAPPRCASGGCARPTRTRSSAACSAIARRRSARRGGSSSGSPRCA